MATKKQASEKAAEIKEEVKAVTEKTAEKAKTTAAKAKKTATKAAAKTKATAAKAATKAKETAAKVLEKDVVVVEFGDKQVDVAAVVEAAKADYKAKGHRAPKTVKVYIKPEDGVAYYTVNDKGSEDQKVDL